MRMLMVVVVLCCSAVSNAQAADAGSGPMSPIVNVLPVVNQTSPSGVTFSMGPSIPLLKLRLADPATGKVSTSLLSAGAGYGVGWGFFQTMVMGKQFDMLNLDLDVFGSAGNDGYAALDAVSIAGAVCTMNSIVCVGFGSDLLQYYGGYVPGDQLSGILVGRVTKANLFSLLSVGFNFALGESTSATQIKFSSPKPERGNTLTF